MKSCDKDVCEDQDKDSEWKLIVYYYYDSRYKQLSLTDNVITDDPKIRYLDHLPTAVYASEDKVTVFMWNRYYVFKDSESALSYSGFRTLPTEIRQIEEYFRCQWLVQDKGLFSYYFFVSTSLISISSFGLIRPLHVRSTCK